MSFDETAVFPTDISYGSRGGPGYNTLIQQTDGGQEQRLQRWPTARRQWDVGYGVRRLLDLNTILGFYHARQGSMRGFRFRDPFDFNSSPTTPYKEGTEASTDQTIGTGDGSLVSYQLIKTYTNGGQSLVRNITKPVDGSVVVEVNGTAQTEGADYTVNTTTGVVTFDGGSVPAMGHVIKAGFEFHTPARFGEGADELLEYSVDDYESGSVRIPVVEVLGTTEINDTFNPGGARDVSTAADFALSPLEAFLYAVATTTSGVVVSLPDPAALPAGGIYFTVVNDGANSFDLDDHTGTTLLTLTTGSAVSVVLAVDDGGSKIWYAY